MKRLREFSVNKYIYLAWRGPDKNWNVIGQLLRKNNEYEFRYTKGIENVADFNAVLSNMPEHDKVYRSSELFFLFKNRLMPKSRPDYSSYLRWLDLEQQDDSSVDDLDTLAVSGGERQTDFFRIIPVPEKNISGEYSFKFLVNGLSDSDDMVKNKVLSLKEGDSLYLVHDFQNKEDYLALSLRTNEPSYLIGYVPPYFGKIIHKIKDKNGANSIRVNVVQVNKDAPIQMRLLCELSSPFLSKPWEVYDSEFNVISRE